VGGGHLPDIFVGLTATRVDGGQLVSGRWSWASGSYQARWAALGIPVVNDSGEVIDQAMAIVPMDDLAIRDTWDMAGMRGTGSHGGPASGGTSLAQCGRGQRLRQR
jgi:alkylation response protein AidB-like acyl-CoA dehydrogenase